MLRARSFSARTEQVTLGPTSLAPRPDAAGFSSTYARRSVQALAGLRDYGRGWLRSSGNLLLFPNGQLARPKKITRFHGFNARPGECDLYTFANVFADYPLYERDRGHTKLR